MNDPNLTAIDLLRVGRMIRKMMEAEDVSIMGEDVIQRGDNERASEFFAALAEKGITLKKEEG